LFVIDALQAKRQFSTLLQRIAAGDEVVIIVDGKPVARLVPADSVDPHQATAAMDELRRLRKTTTLGGLDWKSLRDEGRR